MKRIVATVAVDNTYFSLDTDYSYAVPDELLNDVKIGSNVTVPFGKGNKSREGIVVELKEEDASKLKSIISVNYTALSEEMIGLALWMKSRCFCTTYDCLKQMLPRKYSTLKAKSERMAMLLVDDESVISGLTKKQKTVCDLLLDIGCAGANEICEFCGVGIGVLKNLEKNGIIKLYQKEIYRNPYKNISVTNNKSITLSKEQEIAYEQNKKMLCSESRRCPASAKWQRFVFRLTKHGSIPP